jgi:beta-1,4-mannosyl-glycoprotein beta-1,4-N-acetylglucosaminyltransferase
MKTIDAFIFFNELELLEIRLNILNEKVDKFVLIESTVTHTGQPKKLYYQENKKMFEKFNDKIVHYIVDDTPNSFEEAASRFITEKHPLKKDILLRAITTSNTGGATQWLREFYQHESVRIGLGLVEGIKDEDIVFNSDLDEIWNPNRDYPTDDYEIFKLKQHVYTGFLNVKSEEDWYGTYYSNYKNLKNACLNHLDTVSKTKHIFLDNGGWHFTFQGGLERIKTKIENYGHQEYNNDQVKNVIQQRLDAGMDVLGRPFACEIREDILPQYLINNKEKYKNLFMINREI